MLVDTLVKVLCIVRIDLEDKDVVCSVSLRASRFQKVRSYPKTIPNLYQGQMRIEIVSEMGAMRTSMILSFYPMLRMMWCGIHEVF